MAKLKESNYPLKKINIRSGRRMKGLGKREKVGPLEKKKKVVQILIILYKGGVAKIFFVGTGPLPASLAFVTALIPNFYHWSTY